MHLCKQEVQSISSCAVQTKMQNGEKDVVERSRREIERKSIVHRGVQWPLGSEQTGNGVEVQRKLLSHTALSLSVLTYNADIVLTLAFFAFFPSR